MLVGNEQCVWVVAIHAQKLLSRKTAEIMSFPSDWVNEERRLARRTERSYNETLYKHGANFANWGMKG